MRKNYPSNFSGEQWRIVQKLLPPSKRGGRPRIDRRRVLDAILYVIKTGCQCRQLPHDFPRWKTVYTVFWQWRNDGTWQKIHDALREKVRKSEHRKPTPTVAIVDSQLVRTTGGRKRHLAADTLGLVLAVVVHGAS